MLELDRQMTHNTQIKQVHRWKLVPSKDMQLHKKNHTRTQSEVQYLYGHTAQPLMHAITRTQRVPKRDPRKQEMTAEGRGRSRERTDTIRSLSKRRRDGGRGGERREDTASRTEAGGDSRALDTTAEAGSSKYLATVLM